jgi:hypothetical protein
MKLAREWRTQSLTNMKWDPLDEELNQMIFPTIEGGLKGLPRKICNKLKKKRKSK